MKKKEVPFPYKINKKVILNQRFVKLINLIKIRMRIFMVYHNNWKLSKKLINSQINIIKIRWTRNLRCIKLNKSFKTVHYLISKIIFSFPFLKIHSWASINKRKKLKAYLEIKIMDQGKNMKMRFIMKFTARMMKINYQI